MHETLMQNARLLMQQYHEHTGEVVDDVVVGDAFAVSVALDTMLRQVLESFEGDVEKLKSTLDFLRQVKTHPFDVEWHLTCIQHDRV